MRVVYLMHPTSSNLATCSVFHWAKFFVKELTSRGHYVYWCAPWSYTKSILESEPHWIQDKRIKWIDIDSGKGLSRKTYHYLTRVEDKFCDLFKETNNGVYHYDAIVTNRTIATAYLKNNLFPPLDRHRMSVNPPIYNVFTYIFSKLNPTGAHLPEYEIAQALGAIGCFNVFCGEWEADMVRYSAKGILAPAMLRKAFGTGQTQVGVSWFSTDRMDPYYKSVSERRKVKPFAYNFANAESTVYKFEDFVKQVTKTFQFGRDIRMIITATSQSATPGVPDHMLTWDGAERHNRLPQLEFFKKLSECHGFVLQPREGETSPTVAENLYLGLVGILPDSKWVRPLVPKDYPFIYHNSRERDVMIRYLADNYYKDKTLPGLIERCREHVRKFDSSLLIGNMVSHMEREVTKRTPDCRFPSYVTEPLDKLPKKLKKITFAELQTHVKKHSRNELDIANIKSRLFPSRLLYSWYMRKIGWVDTCETEMPEWVIK